MEWILVYEGVDFKIYKDKKGEYIKYVYRNGKVEIKPFDWSNDDLARG